MVKQHKKISGKSAIVKGLKQMELRPEKSTLHWPSLMVEFSKIMDK